MACYNSRSEVSGWHDCYFLADTAAVLSAGNPFGVRMKTVREVEWRSQTSGCANHAVRG